MKDHVTSCHCLKIIESNTELERNDGHRTLIIPRKISQDRLGYVLIELEKLEGTPLGLTVSGGADTDHPPVISAIKKHSVADLSDSLLVNDHILAVNGVATLYLRHDDISSLVRHADKRLLLEVEYELPDLPNFGNNSSTRSKRVEVILRQDDGNFGFVIRGGFCPGNGTRSRPITVMGVRSESPADKDGRIKTGDRLLAVNGINLLSVSCEEALAILKHCGGETLFLFEYDVAIVNIVNKDNQPLLIEIDKQVNEPLGVTLTNNPGNSWEDRFLTVDFIKEASLAERCGALHVGDRILSIDGVRVGDLSVGKASQLVRRNGKPVVKLEIISVSGLISYPSSQRDLKEPCCQYATMQWPPGDLSRAPQGHQPLFCSLSADLDKNLAQLTDKKTLPAASRSYASLYQLSSTHYSPIDVSSIHQTSEIDIEKKIIQKVAEKSTDQLARPPIRKTDSEDSQRQQAYLCTRTEFTMVELHCDKHGSFGFTLACEGDATIPLYTDPTIDYIEVNGPAHRSCVIQAGDRLVSVNSQLCRNSSLATVNNLILSSTKSLILGVEFEIPVVIIPSSGRLTVKLNKKGPSIGITLKAFPCGTLISAVTPGSTAHRSGCLEAGDQILSINDTDIRHCSLEDAASLLSEALHIVKLKIAKGAIPPPSFNTPLTTATSSQCCDTERQIQKCDQSVSMSSNKVIISVELTRQQPKLPLGIGLIQGEFSPIIGKVNTGSIVEKYLIPGDELLAIHNKPTQTVDEALRILNSAGKSLTFTVARHRAVSGRSSHRNPSGNRERCRQNERQNLQDHRRIPSKDSAVDLELQTGTESDTEGSISPRSGVIQCQQNGMGQVKSLTFDPKISSIDESCPGCREALLQDVQQHLRTTQHLETNLVHVTLSRDSEQEGFGLAVANDLHKKGVFVSEVRPGGFAERSDLIHRLDKIIKVNGVDTKYGKCAEVVALINMSKKQLSLLLERRNWSMPASSDKHPDDSTNSSISSEDTNKKNNNETVKIYEDNVFNQESSFL